MKTLTITAPEGYEFTGEIRRPRKGDLYLLDCKAIKCVFPVMNALPILRKIKKWEWPKWLTVPWIAMDDDGDWYGFASEPDQNSFFWSSEDATVCLCEDGLKISDELNFPDVDWRERVR